MATSLASLVTDEASKRVLRSRKVHNGPFLRLQWPVHGKGGGGAGGVRRPVHTRLHLRQFAEDGSFGVENRTHSG
eukprot:1182455-Prorocentrum_minimum.AAC.1